MKPKISVILNPYNAASLGFFEQTIESVLAQTYKNYELVIVDDGSTDNTQNVCRKYLNNPDIKYIYQDNKGLAASRNTGINASKGDYICFIDHDDIWKPEKLQKQITFFKQSTDNKIGMVYTSLELIDEKGNIIGHQSHIATGNIYEKLFYENIVDGPSSVMIKKEVFDKVGLFREYNKSDEDTDMWIRIAKEYSIFSLNEYLVQYRIHQNKMSTNHKKHDFFQILTLYEALNSAPEKIQQKENEIYSFRYQRFALKHFSLNNFAEFKKYYIIALAYAPLKWNLKIKYVLSYFPFIVKSIKKISCFIKR